MPDIKAHASIGLNRLSQNAIDDAPQDTKYIASIQSSVNGIVDHLEQTQRQSFLQLLKSADVELAEVSVQVPDPWVNIGSSSAPAFLGTWANTGGTNVPCRFMKHHDGSVEVQLAVSGGVAGTGIFTLPTVNRPSHDLYFASVQGGAFAQGKVEASTGIVSHSIGGVAGFVMVARFTTATNSTPQPLSCWPKYVSTKLTSVAGVVVCDVKDDETSNPLPTGSGNVSWEITSTNGVKQVRILNIPFLPYNRKCKVKVLIFGGG